MKKLVIFFILLFSCSSANAAPWYVDNSVGTSGDGTSWATAWKNFSNITGVSSGDTVYISGGTGSQTYQEQLNCNIEGVTYRPGGADVSPSGHDGTVIIDRVTTTSTKGINVTNNTVTIDGNVGGTKKIQIKNAGNGVYVAHAVGGFYTGVTVRYIEEINCTYGIYFQNAKGEIDHNYIHDMNSGAESAIVFVQNDCTGVDFTWGTIHDNNIETPSLANGTGADGIEITCGGSIYNNVFKCITTTYTGTQHADGIQSSGNSWVKAYNNEFIGWTNSGIYYEYCHEHCWAFNNYFWNTREPIALSTVNAKNEIRFDNNTIVDYSLNSNTQAVNFLETGKTLTNSSIRNNIIINYKGTAIYVSTTSACGTDVVIDNNVTVAGSQGSASVTCNGSAYTQPTYSSNTQPTFASYTEFAGSANDLHLASGDTQAKDKGVSLSSYFTTDKDGTTRPQPQGGLWDIGAYELFVPSSSALTSITITNGGYIH